MRLSFVMIGVGLVFSGPTVGAEEDTRFEKDVAAVFVRRCLECHNERDAAGGLKLTRSALARRGGESGPVIQPGKAAESQLMERVRSGEMPPPRKGVSQKLPGYIVILEKRGGPISGRPISLTTSL
ncbi:MAG: c-type cytochrome domain-containing protein [Pirellulaceae bacterium]|jgi:hypothetical protein|nr:c-type cytochrome domain-containing protein [Pirellulaceae bacterium]MDP7014300.1 c-type cytochrome domain-containing protein [Pirellulaceae bacterium]